MIVRLIVLMMMSSIIGSKVSRMLYLASRRASNTSPQWVFRKKGPKATEASRLKWDDTALCNTEEAVALCRLSRYKAGELTKGRQAQVLL